MAASAWTRIGRDLQGEFAGIDMRDDTWEAVGIAPESEALIQNAYVKARDFARPP